MIFFKQLKINSLIKKIKNAQSKRLAGGVKEANTPKEINLLMRLASIYRVTYNKTQSPCYIIKYRECLRAAALLEHPLAQFELGQALLEDAKIRDGLEKEGLFANPNNAKWAERLFEEAHAYLQEAVKHDSIAAKRLLGLAYINGWGVISDKEKGFDLVLASIEQEGSWDKVPQIFAKIGLNKPEFFAALSARRHT